MDNRNKAPRLYGTPLSKVLDDEEQSADVGSINRRRARLDRHQIVKDEQGRRRFHGAFTGGFSAGYHNTVDSIQGFQPKSFSSHRGSKRSDGSSSFSHRPEDYMDEEDFSEFGIAPKKIRLAGQFSRESFPSAGKSRVDLPIVVNESIGEKIFRCMTRNRKVGFPEPDQPITQKTDNHGLGYKPLHASKSSHMNVKNASHNPLIASLKTGMKLKIAGEAFGVGILDEDDDTLHVPNEYGYDDIANYDFSQSRHLKTKINSSEKSESKHILKVVPTDDPCLLPGFVLADDLDGVKSCDNECLNYPLPVIEDTWKMPVRTEPLIRKPDESETNRKNIAVYKSNVGAFSNKFTQSESSHNKITSMIEGRSGLVLYSDLKLLAQPESTNDISEETLTQEGTSIKRKVVDWRPCSLLCKHFGVENPYPDNKFCGVRSSDLCDKIVVESIPDGIANTPSSRVVDAPLELLRSIFNVSRSDQDEIESQIQDASDDDEPQFVETESPALEATSDRDRLNDEETAPDLMGHSHMEADVILVDVPKKQPEVIVLSSSDESKSGHNSPASDSENDDETYGPPLPPSRRTLKSLDRFSSKYDREDLKSSSEKSHKFHKQKRHKSKKSKKHKANH